MRRWHAMWAIRTGGRLLSATANYPGHYRCSNCGYEGTLEAAIAHVIANQEQA